MWIFFLCVFVSGVDINQLACAVVAGIGLFISLEPEIFQINYNPPCLRDTTSAKTPFKASLPFALSFLFTGVGFVLIERELKVKEVRKLIKHIKLVYSRFETGKE